MISALIYAVATASAEPSPLDALAAALEPEVAALRGWAWKHPVRRSIQTVAEMQAALADDDATPPETAQILAVLGLIPPGYDLQGSVQELIGEQVAGYYDPEQEALVLVDRYLGGGSDMISRMLLVHELAHALDDQYTDLMAFFPEGASFDRQIALRSVVEGSASASMVGWLLQGMVKGRFSAPELLTAMKGDAFSQRSLDRAPPILKAEMLLPYLAGTSFLLHGRTSMDLSQDSTFLADRFLRAAADPPTSSEQILHPEKYWDAREAPVEPVLQLSTPPLATERFGEVGCVALLDPRGKTIGRYTFDHRPDVPACAGWGGDQFALLTPSKGLWLVAWDTKQDRQEFLREWKDKPHGFAVGERAWLFGMGMGRAEVEGLRAGIGMSFGEWAP